MVDQFNVYSHVAIKYIPMAYILQLNELLKL